MEVVGWTELNERPDNPHIKGTVHLWEDDIPVKNSAASDAKTATKMPETACIVVFKYTKPYEYYLAIAVDSISNVMNIAGKDPVSTASVETMVSGKLGQEQRKYETVTSQAPEAELAEAR